MRVLFVLLSSVLLLVDVESSRRLNRERKPKGMESVVVVEQHNATVSSLSSATNSTNALPSPGNVGGVEHHFRKHGRLVAGDAASTEQMRRSLPEINGTGCAELTCGPNEFCVSKPPDNRPVCTPGRLIRGAHSRVARGRGKMRDLDKKPSVTTAPADSFQDRVKQAKAQANEYESRREKKQKKRLQSIVVQSNADVPDSESMQNDATYKTPAAECRRKHLDAVGEHLLDSFKQQQDEHNTKRKKEKRNSTKKELHEDDECICQTPVSWEFQQLDVNVDGKLSEHETNRLTKIDAAANVTENCLTAFVRTCDHDGDKMLSEKEWCCCFADVLPPCLAAQNMVPSIMVRGQPSVMPGAYVPQCDNDGFYHSTQCDANSGQCWCVDRNGRPANGTRVGGTLNC